MNAQIEKAVKDKGGPILAFAAGVCGVLAVVEGSRATLKASKIVDSHRDELSSNDKDIRRKAVIDTGKEVIPIYIPTILLTGTMVLCIFSCNKIHLRKEAGLAAAYGIADKAYKVLKEKTDAVTTDEQKEEIEKAIVKEKLESATGEKIVEVSRPVTDLNDIIYTEHGKTPCIDYWTDRKFYSSAIDIREAIVKINYQLQQDMDVSLNELYYAIGLPDCGAGEEVGWSIDDGVIEPVFTTAKDAHDTVYLVLDFRVRPHPTRERY